MEDKELVVTLEQLEGYQFKIDFGIGPELLMDEPTPLGTDKGPNAARVLSAAIGNCLTASLLFCLQKARVDSRIIKSTVSTKITRNDKGRMRIGQSRVTIQAEIDQNENTVNRIGKCIELFEDFCIVTQSVRQGLDVKVDVIDQNGKSLYNSGQ